MKFRFHELTKNISEGSRLHLAKGITLIESTNMTIKRQANNYFSKLLPIQETVFGLELLGFPAQERVLLLKSLDLCFANAGHKVAVLAIDPSSSITGGSILGDKTRMEELGETSKCIYKAIPNSRYA